MKTILAIPAVALVIGVAFAVMIRAQDRPAAPDAPAGAAFKNLRIQGSLDLENGVPIRWKKPDGSGYVNIFVLAKNGTLRLCDDSYFYDASAAEKKNRVIEIRHPHSRFPDFQLPITRNSKPGSLGGKFVNADSKLKLRSATFVETNDPAELNLVRTGDDAPPPAVKNELGSVANGGVPGIIRWMARRGNLGFTTDAAIIARGYGGVVKGDHYGAIVFQIPDARYPDEKGSPLLVMKPGVRIGGIRGAGGSVTGGMLEVDSFDDRPVVLRRTQPGGLPVRLALATGEPGTVADATNSLALFKASTMEAESLSSRLEIQTNKGKRLETDWVLPVPAAQLSRTKPQRLPSSELVPLVLDSRRYDTDAMSAAGGEATRLTCRTAGRYAISVAVEFAANGKGSRQVIVRRNGRDVVAAVRVPAVDGETTQITFTSPPVGLQSGDYVEVLVRQTSGQPLDVPVTGELAPVVSMVRVG